MYNNLHTFNLLNPYPYYFYTTHTNNTTLTGGRLTAYGKVQGGVSNKFDILRVGEIRDLPQSLQKIFPSCAKRVGVIGDGSCLFHAIVAAREGSTQPANVGHKLRFDIANKTNLKLFKRGWLSYKNNLHPDVSLDIPDESDDEKWKKKLQDFKKKMLDKKVWSDLTMIPFIMYYLNINLVFFDNTDVYCDVHYYNDKRDSVFIAWTEKSHFEAIFCSDLRKKKYAGYYPPRVARKVMKQYNKKCKKSLLDVFNTAQWGG